MRSRFYVQVKRKCIIFSQKMVAATVVEMRNCVSQTSLGFEKNNALLNLSMYFSKITYHRLYLAKIWKNRWLDDATSSFDIYWHWLLKQEKRKHNLHSFNFDQSWNLRKLEYSQTPQDKRPDKTDSSIKRTLNFGPCHFCSHLLYFKSLSDGHLSKTDNGHFEIWNGQLKTPFHFN